MKAFKDYVITEGAKNMYVTHRQTVDDIIRENKRVADVLMRDSLDWKQDKVASGFKKDAVQLEKALTESAKLARRFWETYNKEF